MDVSGKRRGIADGMVFGPELIYMEYSTATCQNRIALSTAFKFRLDRWRLVSLSLGDELQKLNHFVFRDITTPSDAAHLMLQRGASL